MTAILIKSPPCPDCSVGCIQEDGPADDWMCPECRSVLWEADEWPKGGVTVPLVATIGDRP